MIIKSSICSPCLGPTTGTDCHRFFHPLILISGNGHGDQQDHTEAGAHPQAGGGHGVAFAAVGLPKLQRGDGLLGVSVDAGHAGAARAAEGVLTALCSSRRHSTGGDSDGGDGTVTGEGGGETQCVWGMKKHGGVRRTTVAKKQGQSEAKGGRGLQCRKDSGCYIAAGRM